MSHKLNVSQLQCPMPLLKTKMKLKELNSGDVLHVTVTDSGSINDIPKWAIKNNFQVAVIKNSDLTTCITIIK